MYWRFNVYSTRGITGTLLLSNRENLNVMLSGLMDISCMSVFNWVVMRSFISDVFMVYSSRSFLSNNEFTLRTMGKKEVLML